MVTTHPLIWAFGSDLKQVLWMCTYMVVDWVELCIWYGFALSLTKLTHPTSLTSWIWLWPLCGINFWFPQQARFLRTESKTSYKWFAMYWDKLTISYTKEMDKAVHKSCILVEHMYWRWKFDILNPNSEGRQVSMWFCDCFIRRWCVRRSIRQEWKWRIWEKAACILSFQW